MKKLLKWLLFLTLALAIGATVLLFNPGLVKVPLERYLSDLTGYPTRLEGDLELDLGSQIEITATDISIFPPDRASQQELIKIGYLNLVLVTKSLFEDILVLESLRVDDLQVKLETNPDGTGNWENTKPQPPKSVEDDSGARVVFNTIQLNNASLSYLGGKKGLEHRLHITSLVQTQQPDGMLQINLAGDYNDKPLVFDGNIGPYANLLDGNNISFSGSGNFGFLKITGNGLIDDLLQPRRPQFDFEFSGPDIDAITTAFGIDDLGAGQFFLRAKGSVIDDHYSTSLDGDIGDISLNVSAQVSDLMQLDELDLSVVLHGPSLGSFTRAFGLEDWPDKPFRLHADIKRVGGTLNIPALALNIGGTELVLDALLSNFPHFDSSRIKLSITGDDIVQFRELLGIPGIASGPFTVRANLDVSADRLELLRVEVNTSIGHATLSGTLGAAPDYIGSKLHLHFDGDNAYLVMSALGIDALPEQPFNLDARIESVEHGLLIERGVLVTIEDERLELGGFLALVPGSYGTELDVKLSGKHLNRMLRGLVGDTEVPDQAYELGGRVQVLENGIQLEGVKVELAEIKLEVTGLITHDDQPPVVDLDFKLGGDDLSALGNFALIGDSVDVFVAGQPYQAAGRFTMKDDGWQLDAVVGRIGESDFTFDGLISNQPEWAGTNVRFSIKGPDLHALLVDEDDSDLLLGEFQSSGEIKMSEDTLSINDLVFETENAYAKVDLELGWPISSVIDARFDVNIRGDDIRHLIPDNDVFEPELASYKINAVGQKQGALLSLQHFDARIGNLQVTLSGEVDDDPNDQLANISFSVTSDDLSALGLLNGNRLPPMALELKANFEGNTHQFLFNNLTGKLGDSDIAGSLEVSLAGTVPRISLTAKSEYIDIRPFMESADSDAEVVAAKNQDRLIPPTPLPLEALAAADIELKLDIAELRHLKDSLSNIRVEATTQSGHLMVPLLKLRGPRGKLNASFSIHPNGTNRADVKFDLNADKLVLNLTGQADNKLHQTPTVDAIIHVNGTGGNLQEVAGSLNGSIAIGSRGGTLEGVNLSVLDTFILDEIFSLVLPKSNTPDDLDLTCAATIFKITDGLLETDPALAFTTSRITLVSKGSLDLKTEEIRFNFNATPNNALKLSAGELFNPYILVGGTLSEPAVGLDPGKVLLYGGAAIGTAGISILAKGLLDRVSTAIPVCEDMLKQVQTIQ